MINEQKNKEINRMLKELYEENASMAGFYLNETGDLKNEIAL